jgi:hypothetical protein
MLTYVIAHIAADAMSANNASAMQIIRAQPAAVRVASAVASAAATWVS